MTTLLGIAFDFMGMTYYRTNKDVEVGGIVVVETPHGTYPGKILKIRVPSEEEKNKENFNTLFPEIVRIATFSDIDFMKKSTIQAEKISKSTQQLADQLKLNMKVLKSYLDINEDKVLVTFTSDARVDFRELVRVLSGMFHLKIELRQIGPRDQAKLVGGLGPCGLPLCCSSFLKSFDGISISMAKNQLLSINIPKLSGQCGKLMCCLKYEDEDYATLRPLFPKIGDKFDYNNKTYEVTGLNVLIGNITTYNGDSYETFTKEEFERVKKGLSKVDESKIKKTDLNSNVDLSGHGVKDTINRISQIEKNEKKHREEVSNKFKQKGNQNKPSAKPINNFNKNGKPNGHTYNGKNNHAYNNTKQHQNQPKKDSGFIPVSELSSKQIFDFIPVKKDDKK